MSYAAAAAEDIKSIVNRFKGFQALQEKLEAIGNMEQVAKEAEEAKNASLKAMEEVKKQQLALETVFIGVKRKLDEAEDKLSDAEYNAKAKAEAIINDAKDRGARMLREAQQKTEEVIKARTDIKNELQNIANQCDEKRAELEQIKGQISDMRSRMVQFIK